MCLVVPDANEQYGLGLQSLEAVAINWMGGWYTDGRNYEMILSDGAGKINADQWFWEAFGRGLEALGALWAAF